jgi:hypothetical protein
LKKLFWRSGSPRCEYPLDVRENPARFSRGKPIYFVRKHCLDRKKEARRSASLFFLWFIDLGDVIYLLNGNFIAAAAEVFVFDELGHIDEFAGFIEEVGSGK